MSYTFKRGAGPQAYTGSDLPAPVELEPGQWAHIANPEYSPDTKALVRCPLCKWEMGIGAAHSIGANGVLHPSLVCANKSCTFHERPVTLEGWDGGARPNKVSP